MHNSWKEPNFQSQHPHQPNSCRDCCRELWDCTSSKHKGVHPYILVFQPSMQGISSATLSVVAKSTQGDTNPSLAHRVCRKFSCSNLIVNLSLRVSNSNHGCCFKEQRLPPWRAFSFYSYTKVNYYISCMLYISIYMVISYYKYTCIIGTLFHICHTKYFFGR